MEIGIDISYAVSRDRDLINWVQFLEKPNKSDLEWVAAQDLSKRWQTNAVAYVSVYLPRSVNPENRGVARGTPLDNGLVYLSKEFSKALFLKDSKKALDLYRLIQKAGLVKTMQFLNNE